MTELWGLLNYWRTNPSLAERKFEKLMSSAPEGLEASNHDDSLPGTLLEARRYLLFGDGINDDVDEPKLKPPPHFIMNFCLDTVFTASCETCKWDQSLNALDYLQALECGRQLALRSAAKRLGLHTYNFQRIIDTCPTIRYYVMAVDQLSPQIESEYAKCYMNLRQWHLFYLFSCEPLVKQEALAYINTLFPPDLKIPPSPRISKAKMDHYRRVMYTLFLAVQNDRTVIDRVIQHANSPDSENNMTSNFASWSETRDALEKYLNYAKSMIEEAEKVEPANSNSAEGTSSSTALTTSSGGSMLQKTEYDKALADFLGFGQELDVKQRHVKGLVECLRRIENQEEKNEELQNLVAIQQQEITELKRTHTMRRKSNLYTATLAARKASHGKAGGIPTPSSATMPSPAVEDRQCPAKYPLLGSHSPISPNIASETSTTKSLRTPSSLHEPPPIETDSDKNFKSIFSGLYPRPSIEFSPSVRLTESPALSSLSDHITGSPNSSGHPTSRDIRFNPSLRHQDSLNLSDQPTKRVIRPFQSPETTGGPFEPRSEISIRRGDTLSKSPAGKLETGASCHTPCRSSIDSSRPTTEHYRHQRRKSSVRSPKTFRNPLPDTPEVLTPPINLIGGRKNNRGMTANEFLQDYNTVETARGHSTSVLLLDALNPTKSSELPFQNPGKKKFAFFGKKKKDGQNAGSLDPEGLGLAFTDSSCSSRTQSPLPETKREAGFEDAQRFVKKKPSFASIFRKKKSDTDSDYDPELNPRVESPVNTIRSNTSSNASIKREKKKKIRIRSKWSGRVLEPSPLTIGASASRASPSTQSFSASPRNLISSQSPKIAIQNGNILPHPTNTPLQSVYSSAPRQSIDSMGSRESDIFFGRPESALSQTSRASNRLRKKRSNISVESRMADRTGAMTPTPRSPKTPKSTAGRGRKYSWSTFRSPRSKSSLDQTFASYEHEPFPKLVIPPGFQFPDALENETAAQTVDIEKIRADMIALAYANQGLDQDDAEKKVEEKENSEGNGTSASDKDKLVTPTRKDGSPIKKIEKIIEVAFSKSYSPSKPELVTWHLNLANNKLLEGSNNSTATESFISSGVNSRGSTKDPGLSVDSSKGMRDQGAQTQNFGTEIEDGNDDNNHVSGHN